MRLALLVCVSTFCMFWPVRAAPQILGVLEHPQCNQDTSRKIRPLFLSENGNWTPFYKPASGTQSSASPTIPKVWTISKAGRKVGTLGATEPAGNWGEAWIYRRDHLLLPDSAPRVPAFANRSKAFTGWCEPPADSPLVASALPVGRDKEGWSAFTPPAYRFGNVYAAYKEAAAGNGDKTKFPRKPEKPERMCLGPAFRNGVGMELLSIRLDTLKVDMKDENIYFDLAYWFRSSRGKMEFLGKATELIEHADYDGDGKTEFLFWHAGYNRDGYVLLQPAALRRAEFIWSYH